MNLRFWQKREIYGATIPAGPGSLVSGFSYPYVRPEVDFAACYDYYRTIGKVQNAVESYVAEILSRDWYYEGEQAGVRALEEWEERFDLSRLIEYIVRDWLVCGNSIIGTSDWQPVQMSSIIERQTMDTYLTSILQYSALRHRIYDVKRIYAPATPINAGKLIRLVDPLSGVDADAEVVMARYHFNSDENGLGTRFAEVQLQAYAR